MSLNPSQFKKFLLTAGLLIVLGQGLWQLPEIQDHFYPVENVEFILKRAKKEFSRTKDDLMLLNRRVDYLKWFQAHNGPGQMVSADRLLAFPFSECIRSFAPEYFWQSNIRLAHKTRVKVERKLMHLDSLLNRAEGNSRVNVPQANPLLPAQAAALSDSMKQIQQYQVKYRHYNAELMKLTQQLNLLENNGYKN